MEHLVLLIAQMVFMMMEPWFVRNVQQSVLLVLAPKIAPSATYQPQAILRTSSKVGVIALAQTLFIPTHPSSVLSATVIARTVSIQRPIA
jgi:hypothetical protein